MGIIGSDGHVAILGALARELTDIRRRIRVAGRMGRGGVQFWSGFYENRRVVLVQTGVGPDRALRAARLTLSLFPVDLCISVGYACGLKDEIKIGDLVVGEKVILLDQDMEKTFAADSHLLFLVDQVADRVFKGSILTVGRVIENPEEKQALAKSTGAIVLDMESAAVAQVAAEAGVPCLFLRAVSDLANEDLSGVSNFLSSEGTIRPFRGTFYIITHPSSLAHLNRLRMRTATASRRLGDFIHSYLHHLT